MTNWITYQGGRWPLHPDSVDRLPNRCLDQIEAVADLTSDEVINILREVKPAERLGVRRQRLAVAVLLWAAQIRAGDEVARFADFYDDLVTGDIDFEDDDPPADPPAEPEPEAAPDPTAAASDPDAANDAQQ